MHTVTVSEFIIASVLCLEDTVFLESASTRVLTIFPHLLPYRSLSFDERALIKSLT